MKNEHLWTHYFLLNNFCNQSIINGLSIPTFSSRQLNILDGDNIYSIMASEENIGIYNIWFRLERDPKILVDLFIYSNKFLPKCIACA